MRFSFISSKRFKNLSLANRIGLLMLIVGFIGLLDTVGQTWIAGLSLPARPSHITSDIQGIWYCEYTYPVQGGTTTVRGTTEYFSNGSSNFVGQLLTSSLAKGKLFETTFDIDSGNDWQASDEDLTMKVVDVKSHLKTIKIEGTSIDISQPIYSLILSRLEDFLPKGISEHYKIIEYTPNQIRYLAKDPFGHPFEIIAQRVQGRFVRS